MRSIATLMVLLLLTNHAVSRVLPVLSSSSDHTRTPQPAASFNTEQVVWPTFKNSLSTLFQNRSSASFDITADVIVRPINPNWCYVQPTERLPWTAAEYRCRAIRGGQLASIASDPEWPQFFDAYVESSAWVGAVADYTGQGIPPLGTNVLDPSSWSIYYRWTDNSHFDRSVVQLDANEVFLRHIAQRKTKCLYKVSATDRAISREQDWFKVDECDTAKNFVCKVPCARLNLGNRLNDLMVYVDPKDLPRRFGVSKRT